MTTDELISALEKSTGPDRALDRAIADYVYDLEWKPYCSGARKLWGFRRGTDHTVFYGVDKITKFTHSIDDALTLVPDGWIVEELRQWRSKDNVIYWECALSGGNDYVYCGNFQDSDRPPNAAIALCIAALKARESRR